MTIVEGKIGAAMLHPYLYLWGSSSVCSFGGQLCVNFATKLPSPVALDKRKLYTIVKKSELITLP